MLCQNCHKNMASVRYAEVVDGQVCDIHLCRDCLTLRQDAQSTGFEFASPSPFVRKQRASMGGRTDSPESRATCPSCGRSLKSVLETGRVGCSACYEAFPAQIESMLEGLQMGLAHRGKVPHLNDARARIRSELQAKRSLMKTALTAENYEDAASLRDDIRSLETGLSGFEAESD